MALLALENCLNLVQAKGRSETPVGEREQEVTVGPPQSQDCSLKLVAHPEKAWNITFPFRTCGNSTKAAAT